MGAVFALVVRFDLHPGAEDAFDALVARTAAGIRASEPGTLLYLCHRVQGDARARIFYELYRDRSAFEAHEQEAHTRAFLAERQRYLAGPARVQFLDELDGKGWPAD